MNRLFSTEAYQQRNGIQLNTSSATGGTSVKSQLNYVYQVYRNKDVGTTNDALPRRPCALLIRLPTNGIHQVLNTANSWLPARWKSQRCPMLLRPDVISVYIYYIPPTNGTYIKYFTRRATSDERLFVTKAYQALHCRRLYLQHFNVVSLS